MLVIRPARATDIDDLLNLAEKVGKGMTSLPSHKDSLQAHIEHSITSFGRSQSDPEDYFLLLMEDMASGKVVGTAAVHARTGTRQAFYGYRLMAINHYSHSLGKKVQSGLLHLCNDYADHSELSTLFLDPNYRGNGQWLSRSRYLLMGQIPERFVSNLIAEIRGWLDAQGNSPFWEAIGRHFFSMEFEEADRLCSIGSNQFITELMPKYPIYTSLLPKAARDLIGKPHDQAKRAMELLLEEGFEYENVVDLFDGGPMLRVAVKNLRSLQNFCTGIVETIEAPISNKACLMSNASLENLRILNHPVDVVETGATPLFRISRQTQEILGIEEGNKMHLIRNPEKIE